MPSQPYNLSMITSLSYLLQKLEIEYDQDALRAHFADLKPGEDSWPMISLFAAQVEEVESGDYATWPTSDLSIIRFQYQDQDEPYIEVDGERKANVLDHYCIVADAGDHQIIDSKDGVLKNGNIYGNPVEWRTFGVRTDVPADTPKKPASFYKVLKGGQNCWEVVRQLGIDGLTAQDIADHNGLDDTQAVIPAGTLLHLPYALPPSAGHRVQIEALDNGWPMHVTKPGGTRKYAFGHIQKLEDLKTAGPLCPEGANVTIYGIAHVPVDNDTAAFYLEANAMGNYKKTGSIAWAIGFNHSHLGDGHVDRKKPMPSPQVKEIIQEKLDEAQERKEARQSEADKLAATPFTEIQDEPERVNYNAWKATYTPWKDDNGQYAPRVYLFDADVIIKDFASGKRVSVRRLDGVLIGGPFLGPDGREYYRPQDSADQFTWFGIDPDLLIAEEEAFSTEIPIEDRVILKKNGDLGGKLTKNEKLVTVPLFKLMGRNPRVRAYINKQIKRAKE